MERPQWLASQYRGKRDWLLTSALTTGLAVGGFATSVYGLFQHFSPTGPVLCGAGLSFPVNCPAITLVLRSTILGIPIALLNGVYFSLTLGLCLPAAWRTGRLWVHFIRMVTTTGGVGFILFLIDVEPAPFEEHSPVFISTGALTLALFAIITIATTAILSDGRRFGLAVRPVPTIG